MSDQMSFSQHLAQLGKGMVDAELSEELVELVKAVRETRKKGTLTLRLSMKIEDGTEDMVRVAVETLKTNKPEPARPAGIFWSTYDGDLLRQDPAQQDLPTLREANPEVKPLKETHSA